MKKLIMWTPKEVRKLIAQIAGVLFGIGGIILMIADVKATGKINITTTIVSGQIESGSAGLLLLFFAFFLVLTPSFSGKQVVLQKKKKKGNPNSKSLSTVQKDLIIAITSATLTTLFFLIAPELDNNGHTGFSTLLIVAAYFFAVLTGIGILAVIFDFVDEGEVKSEDGKEN